MATQPRPFFTPEQYLEMEREADYKSEYLAGQIYAMAGASPEHVLITGNVTGELRSQLKGRPCSTYPTDLRVRVRPTGLYTYPDVTVVCGKPEFADGDNLLNPTLIVEVLSDSTEAYDRGEKFAHYRTLDTLKEYVLVSQDKPRVEKFSRQADGTWVLSVADGMEAVMSLSSIGCELRLNEVYDRIEFPIKDDALPEERERHGPARL
jgi:Uma2 family endonuclease